MNDSFQKIIGFTIQAEGGERYTCDPNDPGGATKYGISKRFNPDLDIEHLTLEQAEGVYFKRYWGPAGCPALPAPLNMAAFDSAVNPGLGWVEETLKTCKDWRKLLFLRLLHYSQLVRENHAKAEYIGGWAARVALLWNLCEQQETEKTA
ncbi:MAG: hypothetical protein M0Z75_12995 [Nitrospiraceae bacterium]|nr:hypothetical protein [Nitrospiraceae bacterium]